MQKNSILLEMVDQNKTDVNFLEQIKNTRPETKEFLNSIVKSFEAKEALDDENREQNLPESSDDEDQLFNA